MAFKHGHELTVAIRSLLSAGTADLAVAYWGSDACEILELPNDLVGYRIACDASSGFCSPLALKELIDRGALIVDVPMLHAKVYLSDTTLVAASANASSRGLSIDELALYGLEAGIEATNPRQLTDAKNWFDKVFKSGSPIHLADLPMIRAIWESRRSSRMLRTTLVEAILSASESLTDRKMRVHVYTAVAPSPAIQRAYKKTPYYDSARWNPDEGYPFFWGEERDSSIGKEDLLCFEIENGKASCEGVWRILDKIGFGNNAIWPAQPEPMPLGRKLGATDELDRRVTAAVQNGRINVDADPIALDVFAASISNAVVEQDHLARIESADTRQAYRFLLDCSKNLVLTPFYKTGVVPAIKWYDARRRYVFSFIPNKTHLLFYVRRPALDVAPELAAQASELELTTKVNRAKEMMLRIETMEDATVVVNWLKDVLPLR